jgi:cleavage stimulation factor subunit 2
VQGRKLKVDYSHEGNAAEAAELEASGGGVYSSQAALLEEGDGIPAGLGVDDPISRTLAAVKPGQLFDIIVHMKQLVMADAGKAAEILHQAPQHSYAIFQALLLMNLVDTSILTQAISGGAPAPPPPPPPPPVAAPPKPPVAVPTPPPVPPQPPMQQQQMPSPLMGLPEDQKLALMRQVMSLTPEQIGALPPAQQGAILDLRQKLLSGQL